MLFADVSVLREFSTAFSTDLMKAVTKLAEKLKVLLFSVFPCPARCMVLARSAPFDTVHRRTAIVHAERAMPWRRVPCFLDAVLPTLCVAALCVAAH
jgi:hypothetical protein